MMMIMMMMIIIIITAVFPLNVLNLRPTTHKAGVFSG